jgi:hypothetical protein
MSSSSEICVALKLCTLDFECMGYLQTLLIEAIFLGICFGNLKKAATTIKSFMF